MYHPCGGRVDKLITLEFYLTLVHNYIYLRCTYMYMYLVQCIYVGHVDTHRPYTIHVRRVLVHKILFEYLSHVHNDSSDTY
jgi:hypothetical protein